MSESGVVFYTKATGEQTVEMSRPLFDEFISALFAARNICGTIRSTECLLPQSVCDRVTNFEKIANSDNFALHLRPQPRHPAEFR